MMRSPLVRTGAGLMLLVGLAFFSILTAGVSAEKPSPDKGAGKAPAERVFSAKEVEFFEKQVQPILKAHCVKCHGGGKVRGGLRLTSRAGVLQGGDLGPAVSLEKPEESRLLKAIRYQEGLEMPPTGKLLPRDVEVLTRWVHGGLPWSAGAEVVTTPGHEESGKVTEAARRFWAYQPVKRPEPPVVAHRELVRNPLDAFVLHELEAKGLEPVGLADRVALVRRAYYDLLGLPPTPEQVDAFLADTRPDAWERLIDQLLGSPAYGEKWGRHWLDLVRYAETHGYERDSAKPFAWRYRDYVLEAFNRDLPYDRFLVEQLAGDELAEVTRDSLIATGYFRLGLWDDEPADRLLAKYDVLDGIVSTTAGVVLGMSIGCARCHDHKRDPIPQKDYYRLLAFFRDITDMNKANLRKVRTPESEQEVVRLRQELRQREARLYNRVYELEQRLAAGLKERGLPGALSLSEDVVDLHYKFYRDTWDKLPDFDSLKHETEGAVSGNRFSLAPASRQEAIGLVFTGTLRVPQKGRYTFAVTSSEGVRLKVNSQAVVERPDRGGHQAEGSVELPAGPVPIRLEYFNSTGAPALEVSWSGPGFSNRKLSDEGRAAERVLAADSRTSGQIWSYTLDKPPADWMKPEFSGEGWKPGRGGFGARGTPGAVVRTPWKTADIWLRRTFTVETPPVELALDIHHDDDVEVYLNGQLVYQSAGFLTSYQRVSLSENATKALRKGDNLLAVHCNQNGGGQYIDVGLVQGNPLDPARLMRKHGEAILGADLTQRYLDLVNELAAVRKEKIPEPGLDVMCVEERGRAETHVLIRGNPTAEGPKVEAGFPEVLNAGSVKMPGLPASVHSSGKRRALAEWLVSPSNPLTARVMVNRIWQHHFGRGIVPTSNDFGKLGEMPTHPELLDWLADEFVRGGWQIKPLHRLIMTSNTYRLSARAGTQGLKVDPANTLLWRFGMRRLTAEEVRDSILMASGQLNRKGGGPSVYPPIPAEVLAGQSRPGDGWFTSPPEEAARRSVYVHVKRSLQVPILATHDQADTDSSCAVRYTTTVPTQALGMLNGEFINEQAESLARRLEREAPESVAAQVERAIRLTTGRRPGRDEVQRDVSFIHSVQAKGKLNAHAALAVYALLALNTNEFLYLD
jgi:hypothetical protein